MLFSENKVKLINLYDIIKDDDVVSIKSSDLFMEDTDMPFKVLIIYRDDCPFCIKKKELFENLAKELQNFSISSYFAPKNYSIENIDEIAETVPSLLYLNDNNEMVEKMDHNADLAQIILQISNILDREKNNNHDDNDTETDTDTDNTETEFLPKKMHVKKFNLKNKLLFIYAEWCGFCVKFANRIKNDAFKKIHNYKKLKVSDGTIENHELKEYIKFYPTLLYFDNDGNIKLVLSINDVPEEFKELYRYLGNL